MGTIAYRLALTAGVICSGALNSIFTKYQDNQCVKHCDSPDAEAHQRFEQPAVQTLQMFIGELAVFAVYYACYMAPWAQSKRSGYQPIASDPHDNQSIASDSQNDGDRTVGVLQSIKLAVPSVCDIVSTTLMNVGLVYTPVSVYQMTRGAIVLFVAVLSVLFLKRRISRLEWISLVVVTLGIGLVGYSGSSSDAPDSALVVFGIALIVAAVSFQALQFVFEEHILQKHAILPLQLVYIEGFYGFAILLAVLVVLNFVVGALVPPTQFANSPFNLAESLSQTFSSPQVLTSSVLIMVSIATFNFCGISLTHEFSATARSTIDTCRTLMVWVLALLMGWESFVWLQFVGFAVLVFGTLCFNGVLTPESWSWVPSCLKDPHHANEHLIDVVDEQIERS